jgi:hypothetical protein
MQVDIMSIIKGEEMKIEFELNEAQSKVMEDILNLPSNKGKTANDLCKAHMVMGLIQVKQAIVADELSK